MEDDMSKTKFNREQVQAALDLIADHGGPRGRADLPGILAERFGAKFAQRFGRYELRLLGLYQASRASHAQALERWANEARRRLAGGA
jgi:hypothetical protein